MQPQGHPNSNTSPVYHNFQEVLHHPVVHTAQHIASPLSGALIIFFAHKRWQVPSLLASLRAQFLLARQGEFNFRRAAHCCAVGGGTLAALYAAKQNAPPYLEVTESHRAKMSRIYNLSTVPSIDEALTKWWTSAYINQAMDGFHSWSGLPWWGTIVAATLALRVMIVPLQISLLRNSTRMKFLLPEINALHSILLQPSTQSTVAAKIDAARRVQQLFQTNNCSPWKQCIFFPLVLPPTVLSLFAAIHNLCMTDPDMAQEGTLWFPDLIARDDSYLLPILSGLTWLSMIEMGAGVHFRNYPALRTGVRCIAASTIPLAATLPSGVFVFWITSNVFAIARGYVLRNDAVRRRCGIPLMKEVMALQHLPKYVGH